PDSMGLLRLKAKRGSLWDPLADPTSLGLSREALARLTATIDVISWARDHMGRIGLADLIHEACERLEYDLTLFARGFDGARAWANVLKLARIAQEFEVEDPGDPQAFLEHLRLKRELAGRETLAAFAVEGVDAVRIMSVHAAKGLQFPVTVAATLGHHYAPTPAIMLGVRSGQASLGMKLPCLEGGRALDTLGHRQVAQAELAADLEESKRVFYVACTRAEKALVLCGRSDLSRPAEEDRPIGWLRSALGFGQGDAARAGQVDMGSSAVRVLMPSPADCEMTEAVRPEVDEATLRRARATGAITGAVHRQQLERISYSGIARYRACPYRFYATSVIRLGSRAPRVSTAESPTAFGSAVHVVLSQISDGGLPTDVRIAEICRAAKLAPERWESVGALAAGYLDSQVAKRVAKCGRVMREVPFAVPVGATLLDGAIDLIAFEADRALVLDYKTGHTDDRFDPAEGYLEQARCYAVAASAMGSKIVEVGFVELERESRVHTFEFNEAGVKDAIVGIQETLTQIAQRRFGHLDHYDGLVCAECPALGNLCPISAPPTPSA
ncbi:MAG: PD-(D/E)XK nuclease family protein, partial [Actinobacteria bacterium]|nr:PD-(D/E)XK nuclease family protein [Actinomycetota bacterium]MCG2807870.1 PD-(D/E)XK nuclease family protein [Coriobacteriia bacterium]